jgi:hypothetical protein
MIGSRTFRIVALTVMLAGALLVAAASAQAQGGYYGHRRHGYPVYVAPAPVYAYPYAYYPPPPPPGYVYAPPPPPPVVLAPPPPVWPGINIVIPFRIH